VKEFAMTLQTVSIRLPENLYRRVQQRAKNTNRSVADELAVVIEDGLATEGVWVGVPSDIVEEAAQLHFLDDDHLLRILQWTVPVEKTDRMQTLIQKLEAEGLTAAEEEEIRQLQHYAHRVMLVRAEAAALLQSRGFDISELRQNP
jgi:predicted transcriptional regulator